MSVILSIAICYDADVVQALTDRSKTDKAVKSLPDPILPHDVNIRDFIIHAGKPDERLTEEESDILHREFRELLLPEYTWTKYRHSPRSEFGAKDPRHPPTSLERI